MMKILWCSFLNFSSKSSYKTGQQQPLLYLLREIIYVIPLNVCPLVRPSVMLLLALALAVYSYIHRFYLQKHLQHWTVTEFLAHGLTCTFLAHYVKDNFPSPTDVIYIGLHRLSSNPYIPQLCRSLLALGVCRKPKFGSDSDIKSLNRIRKSKNLTSMRTVF